MGLLEELIILVKETIDENSERKRPLPSAAPPRSAEDIEELRRTLARRATEQRMAHQQAEQQAEQQEEERQARAQHAQHQRHTQERERHHQKQVEAVHSAQVIRHTGAVDRRRVVRLLHQPHTVRELVVLKEILDKPLALRRR